MSDYVHERLRNRISEIVNTMISDGSIKAPGLSRFASVSHVSLSRDNAYATLCVTCLESSRLDRSVAALNEAAGFIQSRLARVVNTKNTPRLTFVPDKDLEKMNRIDAILDRIHAEGYKTSPENEEVGPQSEDNN